MEKYLPLSKEIRYLTRNKVKISSMVCSIMIIDMVSLIANRPQLSATLTFFLVLVMLTINNLVLKIDRHYVSRELQCNIPKSIGVGKVTFRDDYSTFTSIVINKLIEHFSGKTQVSNS